MKYALITPSVIMQHSSFTTNQKLNEDKRILETHEQIKT